MKANFQQILDRARAGMIQEESEEDSRAVLIAPVEDEEGVRFAEEIFLVQLIPAELYHDGLLGEQGRGSR